MGAGLLDTFWTKIKKPVSFDNELKAELKAAADEIAKDVTSHNKEVVSDERIKSICNESKYFQSLYLKIRRMSRFLTPFLRTTHIGILLLHGRETHINRHSVIVWSRNTTFYKVTANTSHNNNNNNNS